MDVSLLSVIIAFSIIVVLLASGASIGVTLGISGTVGAILFTQRFEAGIGMPFIVANSVTTTYGFLVIPMFMLMGNLAARTGIAKELFDTAYAWFGRVPGGLSVSTILTCAGMSAITGSSVATASAMTRIALPELRRYKYDESLAVGTVTVGGTLAIMIPPSITFVIYGLFAEQSIGKLLIAGILPGILNAVFYIAQIVIRCKIWPHLGPVGPKFTWKEKISSLGAILPFLAIVISIVFGILLGVWTPVEASAVGVVGVLLMGLLRRKLRLREMWTALVESVMASVSVMVLVIGAMTFSAFLALTGYNESLTNSILNLNLPPFQLFFVFVALYMLLGMVLEATSILALTVPLVMPAVQAIGWDPIWFGVICVALMEVAAVTPPVGLNLYAVKAADPSIPTKVIFIGSIPFWLCDVTGIFIIFLFPEIALLLPNLM